MKYLCSYYVFNVLDIIFVNTSINNNNLCHILIKFFFYRISFLS